MKVDLKQVEEACKELYIRALTLLDELGAENIMWGSDSPFPDGIWPDAQEHIQQRALGALPAGIRRKIVCENAARLYVSALT